MPVVYTFASVVVGALVFGEKGDTIEWNGKPMPGLTLLPVMLPMFLIELALQYGPRQAVFYLLNPYFRITFGVLFDFFLYALLTYAALRKLGWLTSLDC